MSNFFGAFFFFLSFFAVICLRFVLPALGIVLGIALAKKKGEPRMLIISAVCLVWLIVSIAFFAASS